MADRGNDDFGRKPDAYDERSEANKAWKSMDVIRADFYQWHGLVPEYCLWQIFFKQNGNSVFGHCVFDGDIACSRDSGKKRENAVEM